LSRQSRGLASRHANAARSSESAASLFGLTLFGFTRRLERMNFAAASHHAAKRAPARGATAYALAVVVMTMQGAVVAPPRSPGPGRP
jgi:hypothetical protein